MRYFILFLFLTLLSLDSDAQNWQLVWADEFDSMTLDDTKWSHSRGNGFVEGIWGWGNGELQYYQEENTSISNGVLKIEAREEPQGIADSYSDNVPYYYSSSKIITRDKFEFLQGKVEARIKTVDGQGMWPAFWMLAGGCWPETGEIDIMEQWGNDGNSNVTTGAAHLGNCGEGSTYSAGSNALSSGSYADDFHTYSVEWFDDYIAWYVDEQFFHSVTPESYPSNLAWPFNSNDWYLILNLAITSGGPNTNTTFPNDIEIDYVRVYEYDSTSLPDVTFKVDMSMESLAPDEIVYINGDFNGWCGSCNPMVEGANDVWETIIQLNPGQIEYKFTTNGWEGLQEQFEPETECCLTTYDGPNVFVNRVATIGASDITLNQVCFNSCETCSPTDQGCTDPTAFNYQPSAVVDNGSCEYVVDFLLDMQEYSGSYTTPEINGTFNEWCGSCAQMSDIDGDGIWEKSIVLPLGWHEFKFTIDNWSDQEQFQGGENCTLITGEFINRTVQVSGNMIYGPVCWESCESCVTDCSVFESAPVDLTKSFDPVNGIQDRVQLKWYKATPSLKYTDDDAAACDIKFWAKKNLDPNTGNPIGGAIQNPDTVLLVNKKKSYLDGSPRSIFKWPVLFMAESANNANRAEPNIRYEWKVRCACEHGAGIESPWSDIKIFNTPNFDLQSGVYNPTGDIVKGESQAKYLDDTLNLYPNPSDGSSLIVALNHDFNLDHRAPIMVMDQLGRVIESYTILDKPEANELSLEFSPSLNIGLYVLIINGKHSVITASFSVH